MAVSITIPNVSERTRAALEAHAARNGMSLQEFLSRQLDRLASQPSVDDWLASVRRFAQSNSQESADAILDDLEHQR